MSEYNRTEQLRELHKKRRELTYNKVDMAIKYLIKQKKLINFNSVSQESGITKATLYNNKDIRERIETLRLQQLQVPTPAQVKREMNENNKDALIASLKRTIEKLKKEKQQLEKEKQQLEEQLKINYAELYKQI